MRRFGTRRSPKTAWRARMRGRREAETLGSSPERSAERARFHRECRECARSERVARARVARRSCARRAQCAVFGRPIGTNEKTPTSFRNWCFSRPRCLGRIPTFARAAPSSPEDGGPPETPRAAREGDVDARPLVRGAQARLRPVRLRRERGRASPRHGGRRAFRAAGGCVPRPPRADARRAGGGAAPRAGEPAGGDAPVPRAGGYPGKDAQRRVRVAERLQAGSRRGGAAGPDAVPRGVRRGFAGPVAAPPGRGVAENRARA